MNNFTYFFVLISILLFGQLFYKNTQIKNFRLSSIFDFTLSVEIW